jgi:hypothetical protein
MILAAFALGCLPGAVHAHGGWSVGVSFGLPFYPRPCCYAPYWGFRAYPVYVAPPPAVVVQPVPAVVQPVYSSPAPAPADYAPPPPPAASPAPQAVPAVPTARGAQPDGQDFAELTSGDERARAAAALQLGRRRDRRAVGALTRALREDRSPAVREAAARALGLIGAPAALPALQYAAQADDDRDVRHSASFAADVIRANLGR